MFKRNLCFVVLAMVLQASGCSSVQPTVSGDSLPAPSPTSASSPENVDNDFVREFKERWKKEYDATVAALETNRRLWQESKIENYDFELQRAAEGMGGDWNLTFKVRNGETLPVKKDNKYDYPPSYQYEGIKTVEKLFEHIQQALDAGDKVSVSVEFDEKYGFPKSVRLISNHTTGYEGLEIKKFEIIK